MLFLISVMQLICITVCVFLYNGNKEDDVAAEKLIGISQALRFNICSPPKLIHLYACQFGRLEL